jgi:methylated-DNA-protein-cysteine methyltransferase related protein
MKTKQPLTFSEKAKSLIKKIPRGKVATYGQIAALAGNPLAARQVAWLLHSSSRKDKLPWHRVINKLGRISLPRGHGYETQKALLIKEGLKFRRNDEIDLNRYLWIPYRKSHNKPTTKNANLTKSKFS